MRVSGSYWKTTISQAAWSAVIVEWQAESSSGTLDERFTNRNLNSSDVSEMPTPPPHILVAEDHTALRAQIVAVLAGAGWHVDEASDGRLALQLALEQPPDVLLLDLGLPGLDGLQVCQRLRAGADRHIPVLMLTARDTLADKGSGFAAGADDYLIKPSCASGSVGVPPSSDALTSARTSGRAARA